MTEQSEKFHCQRCKTGFPAKVLWQNQGKRWLICDDCSREWHKRDPAPDFETADILEVD